DLGGGNRPVWEHPRRDRGLLCLPDRAPLPVAGVSRCGGPIAGSGDRPGAVRLLSQRLLFRRRLPRASVGRLVPAVLSPLGRTRRGGSDLTQSSLVAAGTSHSALLGPRWADPAFAPVGLLPAAPPRRRGHGAVDGYLSDHAVPDRVPAE